MIIILPLLLIPGCQEAVDPCTISVEEPSFIKGKISVHDVCDINRYSNSQVVLTLKEKKLVCDGCSLFGDVYLSPTFFGGDGRFTIYGFRKPEVLRNDSLFFSMLSVGKKELADPSSISIGFIIQFRDKDPFGEVRVTTSLWGDQTNSKIEVLQVVEHPQTPESTIGYSFVHVRFLVECNLYYESGTLLGPVEVEVAMFFAG